MFCLDQIKIWRWWLLKYSSIATDISQTYIPSFGEKNSFNIKKQKQYKFDKDYLLLSKRNQARSRQSDFIYSKSSIGRCSFIELRRTNKSSQKRVRMKTLFSLNLLKHPYLLLFSDHLWKYILMIFYSILAILFLTALIVPTILIFLLAPTSCKWIYFFRSFDIVSYSANRIDSIINIYKSLQWHFIQNSMANQ